MAKKYPKGPEGDKQRARDMFNSKGKKGSEYTKKEAQFVLDQLEREPHLKDKLDFLKYRLERIEQQNTIEALKNSAKASSEAAEALKKSAKASEDSNEALIKSAKAAEKSAHWQVGNFVMMFLLVVATIVIGWGQLHLQDLVIQQNQNYNQQFLDLQDKLIEVTEENLYLHSRIEAILARDFSEEGKLIVGSKKEVVDGQIRIYNTGQLPIILQPLARKPTYDIFLNCPNERPVKGVFSKPEGNQELIGVEGPLLKSGEFTTFYFSIDKQTLEVMDDCNVSGRITTSQLEVFADFYFDIEVQN